MRFLLAVATALSLAAGCAETSTQRRASTPIDFGDLPAVTEETYGQALRTFYRMEADHPQRPALRESIVAFLSGRTADVLGHEDYDAVVAHLRSITALYLPAELQGSSLPEAARPVARWIADHGSPRGDEARVLSSYLVLARSAGGSDADRQDAARRYGELARWTSEARTHLPELHERVEGEVKLWEEHARLTPATDVLHTLSRMYSMRQNAYIGQLRSERPFQGQITLEDFQEANRDVARAPLDVAAIYLVGFDVASALAAVEALQGPGGVSARLVTALRAAKESGDPDAIFALARGYSEPNIARPDVSTALCVLGARIHPEDARFPRCLGHLSASRGDAEGAIAYYEAALRLSPDDATLYDEALDVIVNLIRQHGSESDPATADLLARAAERTAEARATRFPNAPSEYEDLDLVIGVSELRAGRATEARERLERSARDHQSLMALVELGELAYFEGRFEDAVTSLRQALDRTPARAQTEGSNRAVLLEKLGDAFRASGRASQARRMYREAFEAWEAQASTRDEGAAAAIHIREGVLYDRLAEHERARPAFLAALRGARGSVAVVEQILAHLVTSEPVDVPLALEVFRTARRSFGLPRDSKVYFAFWLRLAASRAHLPSEPDIEDLLRELARGTSWTGQLAKFATGRASFDDVLRAARGRGEETEAYFYAAIQKLTTGETAEANTSLQRVLDLRMVDFYEYRMAQELLQSAATTTASTREAGR